MNTQSLLENIGLAKNFSDASCVAALAESKVHELLGDKANVHKPIDNASESLVSLGDRLGSIQATPRLPRLSEVEGWGAVGKTRKQTGALIESLRICKELPGMWAGQLEVEEREAGQLVRSLYAVV